MVVPTTVSTHHWPKMGIVSQHHETHCQTIKRILPNILKFHKQLPNLCDGGDENPDMQQLSAKLWLDPP